MENKVMSILYKDGIYYKIMDGFPHKLLLEKWTHSIDEEEMDKYLLDSSDNQACDLLQKFPELLKKIRKGLRKKIFIETAIICRPHYFCELDEDEKTEDICIIAVEGSPWNIKYVPTEYLTDEFILKLIEKDWWIIRGIKNPTEEMCLLAMEQNPWAIYYAKEKTEKLMTAAVKAAGLYKNTNMPQYYKAVLAYIKENGFALQYIKKEHKTYELCKAAIENYPGAIKYINKEMIKEHPDLLKIVEKDL
jgi:hypothetical protein